MGNILSQTSNYVCNWLFWGGHDSPSAWQARVALEPCTLAGAESRCVESMESVRGLVRFAEPLPAPSPIQVQPSSDAFPPRPSLSKEFLTVYPPR